MSLFRRPGEDSSSDESSSDGHEEGSTNASTEELNLLSRINTLDSTKSGRMSARNSGHTTPLNEGPAVSRSSTNVREVLLHSLLEQQALREAAEHLNRQPSDPDVQSLAKTTYQALSRQLGGPIDEHYSSDQMRQQRTAAQQALETVTRGHMTALQAAEGNGQRDLMLTRLQPIRTLSGQNLLLSSIPPTVKLPLEGYPGLHTDRYAREFVELSVVGKGGYGKVYKVRHKLDNSFYAVKRIMVSSARLQKIQENGLEEMETMLEEVRALARLDHGNIVRYHNCWLEFTTAPNDVPLLPMATIEEDKLIEEPMPDLADDMRFDFNDLSLDEPFVNTADSGGGIIFETSDVTGGADEFHDCSKSAKDLQQTPKQRKRRDSQTSQVTVATISSTRSRMSTIEDVNSEDDEIRSAERGHTPRKHDTITDFSQSMVSDSDAPGQLIPTRATGPILTLNVQMSLYETNLASFLSGDTVSNESDPHLHHCFHPCISLQLLDNIISGVEYLHAKGIVHRDLKPANIFLSLSRDRLPPTGSVDVSTCTLCPGLKRLHVTPRIGDFGLVAALGNEALTSEAAVKPVGTEFYRPEGGDARISEKLDVFALGIMAFEMLCQFSTRMERIDALTKLRRGSFPKGFVDKFSNHGEKVQELIKGMTHANPEKRLSCEEVKQELRELIDALSIVFS